MKVLIIGAGAAGITAGHLLAERGVDFEILEASSTHGGRVRKVDDFADFPIDLGAEWIHKWIKAKPAVFTSLLDGADRRFPTFPDKPATVSVWKDGKLRERNWGDLTTYEGIASTTVQRAILDCRDIIMNDRLVEATEEAGRRGLVPCHQLTALLNELDEDR